jgi:hypothetical protein
MGKKNNSKQKADVKPPFLSDRQKKIFFISVLALFVLVLVVIPVADNFRCKAQCLKIVKTPYPEIACKYQCPWLWEKSK